MLAHFPRVRASPIASLGRRRRHLHLHYDRQDHRPSTGAVVDELADGVVEMLLEELDLADVVREALVEDARRLLAHLGEELVRPGETAGDELWRRRRAAVRGRERRDDD